MKTILITGSSGFLGRAVVQALLESPDNFQVVCLHHTKKTNISDKRFSEIQCDILDRNAIDRVIQDIKPTHLVHLAWYVTPQKFWTSIENTDWLCASAYLFESFCKQGGRVFIGAGSLAEYDWSEGVLSERTTACHPNTLYGQSKKSLLEILLLLQKQYEKVTKIIWPRIGYFFGPNEPKEKLIPMMIDRLKNNQPIQLASRDFQRPYAHVKYLGIVFEEILNREIQENIIFNLSATHQYSLRDICNFVQSELNVTAHKVEYDCYPSTPLSLRVETGFLSRGGLNIKDTFFEDLSCLIKTNM